jgi:hypothetical protein
LENKGMMIPAMGFGETGEPEATASRVNEDESM